MKNKIKIVIVDSGVKTTHRNFIGDKIIGYEFTKEGINSNFEDEYGHGTAVFNIIRQCINYADIINIKLKNINEEVDSVFLQILLEHIYINESPDIINLSLGIDVCDDIKSLEETINKITSKGTIIIAAFDNEGSISYPAVFNDVIGVSTGKNCNNVDDFEYIDDNVLNILAKGNIQKVAWTNPDFLMIGGNSFACAHVTVQCAKFLISGFDNKEKILKKFKEKSLYQYSLHKNSSIKSSLKIKNAAIFPFNKEMHSIIRYNKLLEFNIVDVYDSKYSINIGASTSHLMNDNNIERLIVKNINEINWNTIDTLILGHTDELSRLINHSNIKKSIIEEAIKNNKQIYSFDSLDSLGFYDKNIHYPKVDAEDVPPVRCGMMYRISKPVVGIFGTSSRQGKFTLQLKIRELMSKQGYDIGQIGTEPSSLLYGMDYCFPMGYNSTVYIKEFDTVRYLNYIINDLCIKNKDIILVGSQSGTIPYDTGNIVQYTIPQINFLMGTQPDCVVLCANPFDDVEYINRTIKFIESSVNCKVIAIVVFPMDVKDDWSGIYGSKKIIEESKYILIRDNLFKQFGIPIYKLGNEADMLSLINIITDFFIE